jgi:hypothetical protein
VPGLLTAGLADDDVNPEGPLQLYVAPAVLEEPVKFTVEVHDKVIGLPAAAFGGVLLMFTL